MTIINFAEPNRIIFDVVMPPPGSRAATDTKDNETEDKVQPPVP
jgi:hypothetical protein